MLKPFLLFTQTKSSPVWGLSVGLLHLPSAKALQSNGGRWVIARRDKPSMISRILRSESGSSAHPEKAEKKLQESFLKVAS